MTARHVVDDADGGFHPLRRIRLVNLFDSLDQTKRDHVVVFCRSQAVLG